MSVAGALSAHHLGKQVRFTYSSPVGGTFQVQAYLHGVRHHGLGTILFTHSQPSIELGTTTTVHSVEHDTEVDFTGGA